MNVMLVILLLALLLLLSAVFSGSETGIYSVSRVRIDAEAREDELRRLMARFDTRGDGQVDYVGLLRWVGRGGLMTREGVTSSS